MATYGNTGGSGLSINVYSGSGGNLNEWALDYDGLKLLTIPEVITASNITTNQTVTVTLKAKPIFNNISVSFFRVKLPDGSIAEYPAINNTAIFTTPIAGALGSQQTLLVYARDNSGNRSAVASHLYTVVNSLPPSTSAITHNIPSSFSAGDVKQIQISGAVDPEGDPYTYSLILPPEISGSKISGIANNETVTLTVQNTIDYTKQDNIVIRVTDINGAQDDKVLTVTLLSGGSSGGTNNFNVRTSFPSSVYPNEVFTAKIWELGNNNYTYGLNLPSGVTSSKTMGILSNENFTVTITANVAPNSTIGIDVVVYTGNVSVGSFVVNMLVDGITGETSYTTPGSYEFTVPNTVNSLSMLEVYSDKIIEVPPTEGGFVIENLKEANLVRKGIKIGAQIRNERRKAQQLGDMIFWGNTENDRDSTSEYQFTIDNFENIRTFGIPGYTNGVQGSLDLRYPTAWAIGNGTYMISAAMGSPVTATYVMVSSNNGLTWANASDNLRDSAIGGYFNSIRSIDFYKGVFYLTDNTNIVAITTDNGFTFTRRAPWVSDSMFVGTNTIITDDFFLQLCATPNTNEAPGPDQHYILMDITLLRSSRLLDGYSVVPIDGAPKIKLECYIEDPSFNYTTFVGPKLYYLNNLLILSISGGPTKFVTLYYTTINNGVNFTWKKVVTNIPGFYNTKSSHVWDGNEREIKYFDNKYLVPTNDGGYAKFNYTPGANGALGELTQEQSIPFDSYYPDNRKLIIDDYFFGNTSLGSTESNAREKALFLSNNVADMVTLKDVFPDSAGESPLYFYANNEIVGVQRIVGATGSQNNYNITRIKMFSTNTTSPGVYLDTNFSYKNVVDHATVTGFSFSSVTSCDNQLFAIGRSNGTERVYQSINGITWDVIQQIPSLNTSQATPYLLVQDNYIFLLSNSSDAPYISFWFSSDNGSTWNNVAAEWAAHATVFKGKIYIMNYNDQVKRIYRNQSNVLVAETLGGHGTGENKSLVNLKNMLTVRDNNGESFYLDENYINANNAFKSLNDVNIEYRNVMPGDYYQSIYIRNYSQDKYVGYANANANASSVIWNQPVFNLTLNDYLNNQLSTINTLRTNSRGFNIGTNSILPSQIRVYDNYVITFVTGGNVISISTDNCATFNSININSTVQDVVINNGVIYIFTANTVKKIVPSILDNSNIINKDPNIGYSLTNPKLAGNFGKNGYAKYLNNIEVTPGDKLNINVTSPDGGVRLVWGTNRFFPTNAS